MLSLYLSSARLWSENKDLRIGQDVPNRTDAYYKCLDNKRGMQMSSRYIRYLKEISIQENNGVDFPAYTLIMDAINKCMKEELKQGQVIEYSLRYKALVLVEADGIRIPFNRLSDGYRDVMTIVADIATRMCILNPYLKAETFEKTPGIVVIDKLDMHLHPKWQWNILTALQAVFPKVQFIVATHSPIIISSCKEGSLIQLSGTGDISCIPSAYAYSVEDVLRYRQGSRGKPENLEILSDQFDKAMNRYDYTEARAVMEAMKAELGDNHSEVKKAQAELDVIEWIEEN